MGAISTSIGSFAISCSYMEAYIKCPSPHPPPQGRDQYQCVQGVSTPDVKCSKCRWRGHTAVQCINPQVCWSGTCCVVTVVAIVYGQSMTRTEDILHPHPCVYVGVFVCI